MTRLHVLVVVMAFALVLGCRLWIARPSAESTFTPSTLPVTAVYNPTPDIPRDDDVAAPKVDVLGNEVDDAVGDYRIDVQGEVYERHSPQTEVSKLAPPVS
jgi:hypothetical protein